MLNIDAYFDEIDIARVRRLKELSDIKLKFRIGNDLAPSVLNSKAVVVLTYANWEGFYNDCVSSYVRFLQEFGGKLRITDWMLLVSALKPDFDMLESRSHSDNARHDFVASLRDRLECGFDAIDIAVINARSNLNYDRLSKNFKLLSFDLNALQQLRNRLDKELVAWRHSVAHGDQPDLSSMDINDHVDFTANLLVTLADTFQGAMLRRL